MTTRQLTDGRSRGDAPPMRNNSSPRCASPIRLLARFGLALAVLAATAAAGAGELAAPAAAESTTDDGLQMEVVEMNRDYITVEVRMSEELYERVNERRALPHPDIFLGHAERFVTHEDEDAVSLPENPEEALANPVAVERLDEQTYRMYFRTEDVDWPEEDEEITLGLGIFTECTVPENNYITEKLSDLQGFTW